MLALTPASPGDRPVQPVALVVQGTGKVAGGPVPQPARVDATTRRARGSPPQQVDDASPHAGRRPARAARPRRPGTQPRPAPRARQVRPVACPASPASALRLVTIVNDGPGPGSSCCTWPAAALSSRSRTRRRRHRAEQGCALVLARGEGRVLQSQGAQELAENLPSVRRALVHAAKVDEQLRLIEPLAQLGGCPRGERRLAHAGLPGDDHHAPAASRAWLRRLPQPGCEGSQAPRPGRGSPE